MLMAAVAVASLVLAAAPFSAGFGPQERRREVLNYVHTWRRANSTIYGQLANASASAAQGSLSAVAVEAWTVEAGNLSISTFPTAAGADTVDAVLAWAVAQPHLRAYAWLINEADTGYIFNCTTASRLLTTPANTDAFVSGVAARMDAVAGSGGQRLAGLILDLEPSSTGDAACTAELGMAYARVLHRLARVLGAQGQSLLLYAEQWQYHGIHTYFDYDLDGLAASASGGARGGTSRGGVVVGVTYDGQGNFTGGAALAAWQKRLDWLFDSAGAAVADPSFIAAGLSTDSVYTAADIAARVSAIAASGVPTIHVFTDYVPESWGAPLKDFLAGGRASGRE